MVYISITIPRCLSVKFFRERFHESRSVGPTLLEWNYSIDTEHFVSQKSENMVQDAVVGDVTTHFNQKLCWIGTEGFLPSLLSDVFMVHLMEDIKVSTVFVPWREQWGWGLRLAIWRLLLTSVPAQSCPFVYLVSSICSKECASSS